MRTGCLLLVVLGFPAFACAQDTAPLRRALGRHVAVIDQTNREWQGRLIDVAIDAVTLEVAGDARRLHLSDVKRVDAHGDRVIDGGIRGAVFGAALALLIREPRFAGPAALSYGLIGLGLDALNDCTHTIYRSRASRAAAVPPPRATVGISVSW
jgi:hypothetical protein